MTTASTRIRELFAQIDMTPWGPEEQSLVAEAVKLSVELGDEELEYRARMRQTSSANMAGDTELTLSSFAWCLARHDADPVRFPTDIGSGADLMWQFKWMAGSLRCSPAFTEEQIDAVLDDMEEHYRREGLGLSGVWMARFESSWSRGRLDDAEKYRALLTSTPRDEHSHCDACTRSQLAGFFVDQGRADEALALIDELVEGGFSCAEEPEHALARGLLSYLRAGRVNDAVLAHRRSYRLARTDPDNLAIVMLNLQFVVVTGNYPRALAMVERHLAWLAHDGLNDDAHAVALATIALALEAVDSDGHGDAVVRGADAPSLVRFFGEHEGTWTAAELAAAAGAGADRIARLFDARNGNTSFSERIAAIRDLRDERIEVPLGSEGYAPQAATDAPATPEDRLHRAVCLADWGAAPEAIAAATAALADGLDVARLHGIIVGAHAARDDWDAATAALPARIDALQAAGRDAQADVEAIAGLALYGRTQEGDAESIATLLARQDLPDEARGDLELAVASERVDNADTEGAITHTLSAIGAFHDAGLEDRAAAAEMVLLSLRAGSGTPVLDDIDALLERPALTAGSRGRLLELRARLRGAAGDYHSGALDADEASRIAASLGITADVYTVYGLAAMLFHDAGAPAEAAARYRVAARLAESDGNPQQYLTLRYQLGVSLMNAGDAGESAEILGDTLSRETELGVPDASRGQTAGALAQALELDQQFEDAIGAWQYAGELFAAGDDHVMSAHCHVHAGRLFGKFGMHEESVEELTEAVTIARAHPDEGELLMRSLHLLGQATGAAGDPVSDAHLDEAYALAEAEGNAWTMADITDSRARARAARGDVDGAVAAALQAADAFVSAGDSDGAAGSELFAGRVLAGNGRAADSVPVFRAALEHADPEGPLRQLSAIEFGEVLASLGRHGEAAEIRGIADA
ncbi:hypothetical protein [Microbacterium gorillae]|uniref:hypothetical protein n=1 Tax=Microbacterium gorillae TaxID=1231063 RepID=UPI003D97CB34